MSKEDEEVSEFMTKFLENEGIKFFTKSKAVKAETNDKGEKIITIEKDGKTEKITGDEILAAVGRKPNVKDLDLEKANVKYDEKKIFTDGYLRTTAKNIYAAGDVTAHFQFTHMADYEAQIVLQNCFLFFPLTKKADYSVVPWATFTEPEVARVGLTEKEAREKFGDVKIIKVGFEENDRAHAEGETEGFAKDNSKRKKNRRRTYRRTSRRRIDSRIRVGDEIKSVTRRSEQSDSRLPDAFKNHASRRHGKNSGNSEIAVRAKMVRKIFENLAIKNFFCLRNKEKIRKF